MLLSSSPLSTHGTSALVQNTKSPALVQHYCSLHQHTSHHSPALGTHGHTTTHLQATARLHGTATGQQHSTQRRLLPFPSRNAPPHYSSDQSTEGNNLIQSSVMQRHSHTIQPLVCHQRRRHRDRQTITNKPDVHHSPQLTVVLLKTWKWK